MYGVTVGVPGNLNNPGYFKVWVIDACETQVYCLVNSNSTQELLNSHVFYASNDSTGYGTAHLLYANIGTDEEDCLPCYGDGRSEYPFRVYFAIADEHGVVSPVTPYPFTLEIYDSNGVVETIELSAETTEDSVEVLDFPKRMLIIDG